MLSLLLPFTRPVVLALAAGLLLAACHSETNSATEQKSATLAVADDTATGTFSIRHPDWAAHASLYEVNIRQYTPEGTFRAFEQHLPRLQQMGVGILWLMPIHPIGKEKRKGTLGSYYSVQDYRAVNPDMGTLDDLKHLVAEAHKLGMHVILDWVANHTAWDNPLVQEHPDWFTRDSLGQLVPPVADWQDVVDLDYANPALRTWMTATMQYWVREADIDGYRCDVAGLVPMSFWNQLRPALDKVKPVFMLAEWDELHHPSFVKAFNPNTGMLERAFDATYALRLHGVLDSVGRGKAPTSAIDDYLALERRKYPDPHIYLMNFITSHDINSWDGSEYERLGPNARGQAVLTAMLPGIPMVYSGQESGLNRRLKFFDADPISWADYPLLDFFTKLLNLKKTHPALANGDPESRFTRVLSPDGTYVFTRTKGAAAVLVAINQNRGSKPLQLPAPPAGHTWRAVINSQNQPGKDPLALALSPHGYGVWEAVDSGR